MKKTVELTNKQILKVVKARKNSKTMKVSFDGQEFTTFQKLNLKKAA
jgi:hypothetical protein